MKRWLYPWNRRIPKAPIFRWAVNFRPSQWKTALILPHSGTRKIQSLFDRSLRVPRTDIKTGSALQLPIDTSRAGKYLAFDADGDPIASAAAAGTAVVSTFMETVLDDTTAAAARTTLGLGTAAVVDTGTSGTKVPLLDGNNTHSGTVTMSGKSIIDANASIAAHATTMDPWSLG